MVILALTLSAAPVVQADLSSDEARLSSIVLSVGTLADQGEFSALQQLFAAEVTVDYSSAFGGEAEMKSAEALMTQWASLLPGFDATYHQISNIRVDLNKNTAEVRADVTADHYLDGKKWRIGGAYEYRLQRSAARNNKGWEITHMTFLAGEESGSRDLIGGAIEQAAANPNAHIKRQQTQAAVRAFLVALENKDMDAFAAVWADDAVQDMPFAPDDFPKRVVGKSALIEHYAAWPQVSGDANFTDMLRFYPMQDPTMVYAEFKGEVDIIPTGRKYLQTYGGLFHFSEGKITLFREYFNPAPFKYAFGMDEK